MSEQRRVAVLMCHGMGQQVCYETLNAVADAIMEEHRSVGGKAKFIARPTPRTTSAAAPLPRAELALSSRDGQEYSVHLYEAYWAPVTEGKITLWEVVRFLFQAGWNGLQYCASQHNVFRRMLFPERDGRNYHECAFPIRPQTAAGLALALSLVAAVLILFGVLVVSIPAAVAYHAVAWLQGTGTLASVQAVARIVLAACVAVVYAAWTITALFLIAFVVVNCIGTTRKALHWCIRHVNAFTVAATIGIILGVLTHIRPARNPLIQAVRAITHFALVSTDFLNDYAWIMMIGLPIAFWGWTRLRYFLVQFVGDVAIYVTAHTVNHFWEVREEIKRICLSVAREVYACKNPEYTDIVVIGHSLGSVIAYHILNAILVDDELQGRPIRAAERTRQLITFGSPLDKVVFLFRAQAGKMRYRDGLDACLEPFIFSESLRSRINWTNIFATTDIISGALCYYDDPAWDDMDPRRVDNERDRDAGLDAAAAHTGYWTRPLFRTRLYEAVTRS